MGPLAASASSTYVRAACTYGSWSAGALGRRRIWSIPRPVMTSPAKKPENALRAPEGMERVPVELLVALEQPGRPLDEARVGAAGEAAGDHGHGLALELGGGSGEEIEESRGLLGQPVAIAKGAAHPAAVGAPRREVHQEACGHLGFRAVEGKPSHEGRVGVGAGRWLVGLKPCVVHADGGREGPARRRRRRLSAEHRLEERSARRCPEAVHQERDAPEVAADDVVLLSREAGEVLAAHAARLKRGEGRVMTDLLLDRFQLAPDLLDQPLGGGHVGRQRRRRTHGAPFSRASSRVTCPLSTARASVFAAMMKSFRWSPWILWVHQVTVTRPHSVRRAGWCPSSSARAPTRLVKASAAAKSGKWKSRSSRAIPSRSRSCQSGTSRLSSAISASVTRGESRRQATQGSADSVLIARTSLGASSVPGPGARPPVRSGRRAAAATIYPLRRPSR